MLRRSLIKALLIITAATNGMAISNRASASSGSGGSGGGGSSSGGGGSSSSGGGSSSGRGRGRGSDDGSPSAPSAPSAPEASDPSTPSKPSGPDDRIIGDQANNSDAQSSVIGSVENQLQSDGLTPVDSSSLQSTLEAFR